MNRLLISWRLLLLPLFVLSGCGSAPSAGEPISIPTTAPAAAGLVMESDTTDTADPPPLPATSTPLPPVVTDSKADETAAPLNEDDAAVDEALLEIDTSLCAEAAAVQADLAVMAAAGEDVTELEEAVADLLAELDSCPTAPGDGE